MNDTVIGGNFAEEWGVLVKGGAWGGDEGNESGGGGGWWGLSEEDFHGEDAADGFGDAFVGGKFGIPDEISIGASEGGEDGLGFASGGGVKPEGDARGADDDKEEERSGEAQPKRRRTRVKHSGERIETIHRGI
jgi:hypothetical protein